MSTNDKEKAYVTFAPEVMREIAASGLSVEDVVRKAGAKDLEIVPDPIGAQGRREVVTVIMASAAAIAADAAHRQGLTDSAPSPN